MSKKYFRIDVIQTNVIELDEDKLTDEFWDEFTTNIARCTKGNLDYLAEHIAWNHCIRGETGFVEGVGNLDEMNIKISYGGDELEIIDKW